MYCCFAAAVRRMCRGHPGAGGTLRSWTASTTTGTFPQTRRRGQAGTLPLIAAGWDPGLFRSCGCTADAVLPDGQTYTFWGTGVSQGHSDAVRRLAGVRDARAYTYPVPEALEAARAGGTPDPTYLHRRVVYAVAEPGADRARLRQEILSIPGYFAGCDTTVLFISQEEMNRDHAGLPHGGCVLRTGHTGAAGEHVQRLEARLRLDSNPEFTGRVLSPAPAPSGACGRRDAPAV